jgi:hypothetical protein
MDSVEHKCSMCPFFGLDHKELMSHLVKRHRNSPAVIAHCNFPGCGVSFKNYMTFKQHTHRNQWHVLANSEILRVLDGNEHCNIPDGMAASQEQKILANSEAAFILKLTVCHNVSNAAVTDII